MPVCQDQNFDIPSPWMSLGYGHRVINPFYGDLCSHCKDSLSGMTMNYLPSLDHGTCVLLVHLPYEYTHVFHTFV